MKVLAVNALLDPVLGGGTAERTFQMSRFIACAGLDCTVLTLDLGLTPERVAQLAPAKSVALRCTVPRYFLFALPEPRIASMVRHADVIHLMGHWTLLNALVARECLRQKKPYVVCPAGALSIYGRSRWLKLFYNQLAGTALVRKAAARVAIAPNELAQYSEYGIDPSGVTMIPNGIDAAGFRDKNDAAFRSKFNLPDAPFVLFLGRLAPIKGPDLLLEAFRGIAGSHPDIHLVFAGPDGGMLEMLKTGARDREIAGRVHFIGPVNGIDKSHACHAAELLAIPSRHEAMSIVVLEAGICGTPALITDQCGFDAIAEAGGGHVVQASAHALQEGLARMLSDRKKLSAMGESLRTFTKENYLWEKIARQYVALFEQLASRKT